MGSNGGAPMKMSVNEAAQCSAPTVEIKIKTLDSQTFIMRVDKCVPVPELKEQIATVTGVLSEQQRLICRGKVLKDDQLLSAYHVEDGHTLHLVVRQPVAPSSENSSDQPGTDPTSNTEQSPGNQVGPGMVVGTFNISEQGDGAIPDLNRLVSAVLSSFGLARFGSGVDGLDLNQPPSERLPAASGLSGLRNSSSMQSGQAASTDIPVEPLQPPVIPDSMTTLLQYLRHLTQECVAHVGEQNATSQNPGIAGSDGQDQEAAAHSIEARRVLKPEFLAEVVSSTRQLLVGQASDCLSHLARQLNSQASMTDPLVRSITQSYAMRSGTLFQNIGSLLLELGRAVMTLRMGQSPADALVNAGPSVFVSPTGPNPIMVQPLPFQPGANFGSIPVGSSEHVSGLTGGSVGSGFLSRNIDIRIRTGSVFPRREPTGSQPREQGAPPVSPSSVNSAQQDGMGVNLNSLSRETQVRAIPTRTVVAAVPQSVGRGSDSSHGSIGILYPVLARVQHVTSSNLNGTRAPQTSNQNGGPDVNSGQPIPNSASQPHNGNNNSPDDRGLYTQMQSGLEQFLRTVFTGEHVLGDIPNPTASGFVATEAAQDAASSQEAAAAVTDEGIFLSNILHQIMPIISQNNGAPSTGEANPSETQDDENSDRGTSSRHRRDPQSQQNPKRQRRD